jgi:16S rRNA (cytosine1402-N4)-methyltransferase
VTTTTYHVPVMAREIAALVAGRSRAVDGTVGGGGHTALLLAAGASVLGIDRDREALDASRASVSGDRLKLLEGTFASPAASQAIRQFRPDFVLLDLGVSSRQLDSDQRGFSFRPGVPLDMRMTAGRGESAAALLNHASEMELTDTLRDFADEPRARKLARVIVRRRDRQPFRIADDLVNAIRETLGPGSGPADFARIFQAFRIAVNGETTELEKALPDLRDALVPGGILAVITYHSGEDRLVKNAFREWARSCICPPGQPVCTCRGKPLGEVTPRKPILPTADEVAANPRARSAKLRVFQKAAV